MSTSRVKLTKSFIDQLELTPAIYRDSEIIGFAIRVNNSYKTYIVEKKVKGKSIRCKLGDYEKITLEDARILAQQKLKELTDSNSLSIKNNIYNYAQMNIDHYSPLLVLHKLTYHIQLKNFFYDIP